MVSLKIVALGLVTLLFAVDFGSQFSTAYAARSERVRQDKIYLVKGKQLMTECPLPLGNTYAESTVSAAVGPVRLAFRDAFTNSALVLLARAFYRLVTENIIAKMAMPKDSTEAILYGIVCLAAFYTISQYGQVFIISFAKWMMHRSTLAEKRHARAEKHAQRAQAVTTSIGPENLKTALAAVCPRSEEVD